MASMNDMTVGSPTRGILRFAVPLICGYLLQQMYLLIDAAIVGLCVGVNGLAAVGASTSVLFLTMGFCNGACAGFAIPVAQAFGAKDYSAMRSYVANAMRISAVIAVFLTILMAILCGRILEILNTPADVYDGAYTFLMFNFLALPFTIAYNSLSGYIRALGDSKQPFCFLIASSGLNILLDIILIIVCGLGVEGAGIATMTSQAFASVLCAVYIKKRMRILIPQGDERAYDDHKVGRLLNSGIPMGLQFSITAIGSIMLQSANNALGTSYVAAFTASMRMKYLFMCPFENLGVAMATYCGQNIGAHRIDRIGLGLRAAMKIMLIYFVFTLAAIYPFAEDWMSLFVQKGETEIIAHAALFMRIGNYFFPVVGVLAILRYSIQGLGYSNLSMVSGVMEMIARCGVSLWIVPAFGFIGVCYGDPVAWIMADIFLVPCMYVLYRKLKRKNGTVS